MISFITLLMYFLLPNQKLYEEYYCILSHTNNLNNPIKAFFFIRKTVLQNIFLNKSNIFDRIFKDY